MIRKMVYLLHNYQVWLVVVKMDKNVVIGVIIILVIVFLALWVFGGIGSPSGAATTQNLPSMIGGC